MKKFSLWQLFSLLDGRLSTSMDDVYDMLNHIFQDEFSTIGLTVAYDKLKQNNPEWFQKGQRLLKELGVTKETPFEVCRIKVMTNNIIIDVPHF